MTYSIETIAVALTCSLAACSSLLGETAPVITPAPHFWDEIPVSPSTTVPGTLKDDYWHGQYQRVNREVARADRTELVFFGDSITWHWSLGAGTGRDVWKNEYSRHNPLNMGNSGDITPVMLYRVTHGNLDFTAGQQPKVAVLLCGTNNFVVTQSAGGEVRWDLGADCPPQDVAAGARAIAQVFRRRLPQTRVIMMGILPVSDQAKWAKCQQANAVNAALACNRNEVVYLDLRDRFLMPDGSINQRLFADGTHLTPEGYRIWAAGIDPLVSQMMEAAPLDPVKIIGNINKVVESLRSKNVTVKIVLAKIIPVRRMADEVRLLNSKISRYAAAHSTSRSPVVVADQYAGFNVAEDLADGSTLPNPTGARKMAGVFADVVNKLIRMDCTAMGRNASGLVPAPRLIPETS